MIGLFHIEHVCSLGKHITREMIMCSYINYSDGNDTEQK